MASPESFKEQSPVPKASFAEKVTFVGVGLALAGAGWAIYSFSIRTTDDERPPVIVRNGSVHVEVSSPASDGDKGKLEKVQNQNVWHHTHNTAGGPKKFTVVASGVTTSAACPTSQFSAERVRKAVLTYTYQAGSRTVTIDIDAGSLRVTADQNATATPTGDYILDIDTGPLTSMTLEFKKKQNDPNHTTVTCNLGDNPHVVVVQHKQ